MSLREGIRAIQRQLGITTVFVTHDQEEALSISDRIVVMNAGIADQIGTPSEIYNKPATRFVASFVGTLKLIEAKVEDPAANRIRIGDQSIIIRDPIATMKGGDTVAVALRPECACLEATARTDTHVPGEVVSSSFLGSVIRTKLKVGKDVISFDMFNDPGVTPANPGDPVTLHFAARDLLVIRD